jgi:SNF2 family DNA or RNA helicase
MRHVKSQTFRGQALVELPSRKGRIVWITLSAAERADYERLAQEARAESSAYLVNENTANRSIITLQALLIPVRMATGGVVRSGPTYITLPDGKSRSVYATSSNQSAAKVVQLVRDMQAIRSKDPSTKFVIFTEFDALKQMVKNMLLSKGIGVVALEGSMSAIVRGKILKEFEHDASIVGIVLSNSGAHGLSLTCANVVILMEPSLSQEVELQACDRVHRIGQTREVEVLTYIARNTVDERITAIRKMKGQAPAIGENVPRSGTESISHVTMYRKLFGFPLAANAAPG